MDNQSRVYFPQLDSIRGLSFLSVFFLHAYHPEFGQTFNGRMFQYFYENLNLSIDVFFVLSAFLLTMLGINEYKAKGNFSFKNYFIRRVLRIWPLYYLLMLFAFLIVPYVSTYLNVQVTLPPPNYYLFFISNFYLEGHVYFLRFLWTLSVEEQFYLLLGGCLLLLQKNLRACAIIFIGVSILYTFYAIINKVHHDFNTITYLFDFGVGILAAVIVQSNSAIVVFFKTLDKKTSALFFMLLPLIFILFFVISDKYFQGYSPWIDLMGRYVFVIYTGLFIIEQMMNQQTLFKLKKNKFLIYTGRISYGLYCFHGIVLTFGNIVMEKTNLKIPGLLQALIFLTINYLIASLSYQFMEKPILRLSAKWRR
ncbi:MAG: acyltransferase [Ferruginibacter sp.]